MLKNVLKTGGKVVLILLALGVFAGVISGGVGYTLQIIGERRIDASIAALLVSPESVFAALFGWLILGQALSLKELSGCVLVFCAVLLSQIPWDRVRRREREPKSPKEEQA